MAIERRKKIFFAVLCAFILLVNSSSNATSSSQSTSSTKTTSGTKAVSAPASQTMAAGSDSTGGGGSGTITPDLFTGTMSYSIPIEVPVGRKGMVPSLALTYRSNNENGWVGMGWDVEIGAIERSTKNGVIFAGDTGGYVLRMAGSAVDLVQITTDESENAVTNGYRAKIEGGFSSIQQLTDSNGIHWQITDKSGTKYIYGESTASRQDDASNSAHIFKWCLDRVQDTNGNYVTFSYTKDQGQIYPDRIDYTGNTDGTPTTNYVKFYLESRTDTGNMYSTNFSVNTAKRVKTIDVFANGQYPNGNRVRTYKLAYTYSTSTTRSILASVQQFGKDANVDTSTGTITNESTASKLPAITLGWSSISAAFSFTAFNLPALQDSIPGGYLNRYGVGQNQYAFVGDFNGDGKLDYLWLPINGDGRWLISYGTATGFTIPDYNNPAIQNSIPGGYLNRYDYNQYTYIGDFNGDGKLDYLWIPVNGDGRFCIAYGSDNGFTIPDCSTNPAIPNIIPGGYLNRYGVGQNQYAFVGDFNGDGKMDYLWIPLNGDGRYCIAYGSDNGFTIPDCSTNPAIPNIIPGANGYLNRYDYNQFTYIGDFNGDGKMDYMWLPVNGDGRFCIAYGSNTGFTLPDCANSPALPNTTGGYFNRYGVNENRYAFIGDFNGDGKTDYMWIPSNGDGRWLISYGTATGFTLPNYNNPALPNTIGGYLNRYDYTQYTYIGDYNGDGKMDYMWLPLNGDGRFLISYGTGTGFTMPDYNNPAIPNTTPDGYLNRYGANQFTYQGDFNGDSMTDYMWIPLSNGVDGRFLVASPSPTGQRPDLLTSIINGLGGTTTITYKPSTQYQNTQLPFPVQTVSSVTSSTNDINGNSIVSTTTYTYSNGFYSIGEKDFRGFNYVKVTGPVGTNGEQAISETWFHQGNDTAVDVNNPNVSVGYMKGKPYRTRVSDANGAIYSETTTIYSSGSGTAPYFNPPLQADAYICDGQVSSPNTCAAYSSAMHTKTVYTYDQYGNVIEEDQYGDVNDQTDDRTVFRSFAYNPTLRILNKPANEALYSGVTGTTLVKVSSTAYYYDGVTDCTTSSTNQTPTLGNLTRTVRWFDGINDPEVHMAYDTYGNLKCTRDANGSTATLSYDPTSSTFLVSTTTPATPTLPSGLTTTVQYYAGALADTGLYGQVKSQTDPNNATVTTAYDPLGRKVSVTLPDNTTTTWAYVNFGRLDSTPDSQHVLTTNAAGLSTWSYFDGLGRTFIAKKTGSHSSIIAAKTIYNATGTVAESSLPYFDGIETPRYMTFTYDPLGRVKRADNPDGTYALGCYQEGVSVSINADSQKKRETRNAQGKLVKVEEYLGTFTACTTDPGTPYATTIYAYDVLGNLVKVTDAEGNQTKMWYDPLGRKTSMQDPDMGNWTYTYYPNGNLWTQTDAKGQKITFTYDAVNRMVLKHYPSGIDVTYTYDEPFSTNSIGRLTTMSDASGTTQYYYNSLGRTTKSVKAVNGQNYTNLVSYDNIGRMSSLTYPDNEIVNYAYDSGGNLSLVSAPSGSTYVSYANYNALAQPGTASYGNGVTTTYQYFTTNNRLQNITTASSASQIMNLTYSYDNGGNVTGITDNIDNTKSQAFIYDDLNRLWQAQSTKYGALFYSYDQIGNIVSKETISYTYDPAGNKPHAVRSTSDGKTYTYDANGNMLADGTRTMTYNYDNMPQTILASNATTTFVYDGTGSRVKKSTSQGDNIYLGKLYECRAGVCSKYIFAGSTRIAHKTSATDIVYYHQDHLGSSRLITDRTGSKMEDIYYYPFGAAQSDTGGVSMSHKFTSQEFDAETGLYNYNARFYNPVLGRFISADTIVQNYTDPQILNHYSYVRNNPLSYKDPSGHFLEELVAAAVVGAVIGAYAAHSHGGDGKKGAVAGAVGGAVGFSVGGPLGDAYGGWVGGIAGGIAAGAVGGAAGAATYARLNGVSRMGNAAWRGAEYGAIAGVVTAELNYAGLWPGLSSAGGGYASGYIECGSGCARQDALYSFAGSVLQAAATIAFKLGDGIVPKEGTAAYKEWKAMRASYVSTPEWNGEPKDILLFLYALLANGYEHAGHTTDDYVPEGHAYKIVRVNIPNPGEKWWNAVEGGLADSYSIWSNSCTTRYGFIFPSSYANHYLYTGQGAYWQGW